jgi:hypothetical protein
MPFFVLWGRTLKADTPEFSTTSIFVKTATGMEGCVLENVLDAVMDNLKIDFNWFLDMKVIWTGSKR